MSIQLESNSDVTITTLISGIAQDTRELLKEQATLLKVEMTNNIHRAVTALIPIAVGAGTAFSGIILLGIGAAMFLSWLAPEMPLWLCYALVAGTAIVGGGLLALWGKSL